MVQPKDKTRKKKCRFGHTLVFVPKQKRLRCYICSKKKGKIYYAKNRHKIRALARDRQLRYLYGINQEDYNKLLASQNSQCAICGKASHEHYLMVDHCHTTGKVRGLLCRYCNFILGLADDNKAILSRAIEYLTTK